MNRKLVLCLVLMLFLAETSLLSAEHQHAQLITQANVNPIPNNSNLASSYENVTTHEGNLIIDGTQTFVIENCTYIQTGNIYVRDYGVLILRNMELFLNQSQHWQYGMRILNYGTLNCSGANISSNYFSDQYYTDSSTVGFYATSWNSFTWIYGWGANLFMEKSNDSMGDIWISRQMLFVNSSAQYILADPESDVVVENSQTLFASIGTRSAGIMAKNLQGGHISSFNTFNNLTVTGGVATNLTVLNSDLYIHFQPFLSNLTVQNSHINGIEAGQSTVVVENSTLEWGLHNDWGSSALVLNCTTGFIVSGGDNSIINVFNSTIFYGCGFDSCNTINSLHNTNVMGGLTFQDFRGTLFCEDTAINTGGYMRCDFENSSFNIVGNIRFLLPKVYSWTSCNITRDFNLIVTQGSIPVAQTNLQLVDKDNNTLWSGTTNSFGCASLNLTFADNNYTDTLKLEAVKGGFSAATNVSFLSDTPLILTAIVPIPGDLNNDLKVNLADLVILANAYGSKPGDAKWNPNADIDSNGVVGLTDLVILANHYGLHNP